MNTQQQDLHPLALDQDSGLNWTGAWYTSPMYMQPAQLTGRSLTQIVHLHAGGRQIRLRFSHRYGKDPLVLTAVSVGHSLFGLLQEVPAQPVLFHGQETITIEAGEDTISDPIALEVEAFTNLAINFTVAEGDISTGHLFASQTSYISTTGAQSASTITALDELFPSYPLMTTAWWALTGVDVLPEKPINAVVTLGDSTTDGAYSSVDANKRYPDVLARRLATSGGTSFMSVLNAGICWNELLTERYPMAGQAAADRFAWDVLEQAAITDVIVQIGINDLRNNVQATAFIAGLQQLATDAHEHHLRIFGSTILPGSYTDEQVVQWRIINTWLREEGKQWFDGIFDFARALGHPDDETRFDPRWNCGDDIHPNDAGYQQMAEAVDLSQLSGSPA